MDEAVAQLPNHERMYHEWEPGSGTIWRNPITLAAQLEEIRVRRGKMSGCPLVGWTPSVEFKMEYRYRSMTQPQWTRLIRIFPRGPV